MAAKLKERSKLSLPLESIHQMLDVSLTHGHDNICTMESENRSVQKAEHLNIKEYIMPILPLKIPINAINTSIIFTVGSSILEGFMI